MSENCEFTLLIVGLFYSCKCGVSFYFWHEFYLELVGSLWGLLFFSLYCCSVTQLCLTFDDPVDCSTPGFPALHYLLELAQTHVHWVGDAIQPSHFLSPSSPVVNLSQLQGLFQWVRGALCIRWPKYWSFGFSISPSKEYSGLISFRIDWFDLLAVQGTLKSRLQHHNLKASNLWWQSDVSAF